MKYRLALALAVSMAFPSAALAGKADVVDAKATLVDKNGTVGFWSFEVTVRHEDEGWDHYANAFEVMNEHGHVLAVRTLYHPHVDEQPFTRTLTGVKIPLDVKRVIVRAHDSVHGYGGVQLEVTLPWD